MEASREKILTVGSSSEKHILCSYLYTFPIWDGKKPGRVNHKNWLYS